MRGRLPGRLGPLPRETLDAGLVARTLSDRPALFWGMKPPSAKPVARPDRLILVYDADGGAFAMVLDAMKKAVGKEDCPLCEVTYSPLGKRRSWQACERRLPIPVEERHRDQLPDDWGIPRTALPCVLARTGRAPPVVLVARPEIAGCRGDAAALEGLIATALARLETEPGDSRR